MAREKTPCFGCSPETGRTTECHGTCERYLQWKKKETGAEQKKVDRQLDEFANERYERRKKKTKRVGHK